MTLSQSSEINLTDNGKRALNAQNTANNAYNLANGAQGLANGAQKTADGKNSVYRGTDPSTVPTAGLKEGDIYFTDNTLYTWNGLAWEETVSDTTGAEIKAKVEAASQEAQKADADLRSNIESKAQELDASIESTKTSMTAATNAVASDLSTTKSNLDAVSKDLSATKGNMQSGLDSVNKDLSTTKSNLDAVSKDLSDTKSSTQSSLDAINKDLSTAKSDLANVSDDLSKTKGNLADTGQKIETAVSDFQKKTDQLSGSLETANSKIEFNSNTISEVKHTAEEVSTTVSNIRVGGRNLLTNTRTLSNVWTGDTETVDSFTVAKVTKTSGDFFDPLQWYGLTAKPNTDYVLTFYAKASTQTTIRSHLYDIGDNTGYNDGLTLNTLTTDYQRFVIHFHTYPFSGERQVNCIPVRLIDNVTAWIYGVQLEEGNTATQWQPNPTDTDQAISKVSQTADTIRADLTNTQGDVASVKATADSLQTQITDNKNNISSVKQTADSLTTRMSNAEGNVSSLQQTASGLTSTVGQMPAQWQQAINDKTNAQVLDSDVDMNNLTTAGTYLVKDSSVKNAPFDAWFMATVEATADKSRVVQRVKGDADNIAYERSNMNTGWTAWERIATGSDISSIQQTINGITTRVGDTEGNISQLQQTADGLSATVKGGRNQLNNTSDTLQTVTVNNWWWYAQSNDEPIAKHQLDGQNVTLSAWIENPSKEAWVQMYTDKGRALGNIIPAGGSGWSQVTYTMPSGFTAWNIVIGCGDGSGTVMLSYSSLQLELGPNRTAWSQSTADIAQLKITANSLSSDIADAKGNISQLKQTANGLTTRVGDAEGNISSLQQTASGLQSTVSNLHAGDRNYVRGTSGNWADLTGFNNTTNVCLQLGTFYPGDLKESDQITLGLTLKNTGITSGTISLFQGCGDVSGWTFGVDGGYYDNIANLVPSGQTAEIRIVKTLNASDVSNNTIQLQIRTDNVPAGGTLSVKCVYIKRGTLATDWSPAPEDVDSSISQIKQTADKIQTQVGDNKDNISSITETANAVKTDLADAKDNISQLQETADKITTTLSSGGTNLLSGTRDFSFSFNQFSEGTYSQSDQYNDTEHVTEHKVALTAGAKQGFWWSGNNTVGQTYTLSFDARSDNGKANVFQAGLEGNFLGTSPALTTNWTRYHYTINVTQANHNWIIYFKTSEADNVYVRKLQLEYGDTPTPWNPSSGDISQLQQTATQLTSDMKDAKGNISSFQQTAGGLTSRVGSAEDNISQLQQDSKGLTSRVGSAESNISQLQQTASGLTSTVSNMKSGGANMLSAGTLESYNSSTVTYDASTDTYTIVNPASADPSWGSGVHLPNACIEIPWGQTACISMEVYTPTAGTIGVDINNSGDGVTAGNDNDNRDKATFHNMDVPANEWTTIWFTYENSDPNRNPNKVSLWDIQSGIGLKLNSVTWKVRHPVVQLGTFPSGWSPSPKDTDSAVSQIKQTADNITAYVKGSKGSQILSSILSMDSNNSMMGQLVNGKVVAAINLSKEGNVQIDGSHISLNSATYIPDATIKSSMIESLEATKIKAGTLDASKIQVINLDANSITTGSFSAVLGKNLTFNTYTVSPSSPWDFNDTKSNYGNWFLNGEITADHVYNGPKDTNNNKLTPYMYVSSRGVGDSYVVTVWRDYDPTQYQRVWIHDHWTDWVMLPNSQNIVSVINLSPDGVTINGKNIELNGDTTIHGQLNLLPKDQQIVNQFGQGLHNPWFWRDAQVFAGTGGIQLQSTIASQDYTDGTSIGGIVEDSSAAITTLAPTYLKFTIYRTWNDFNYNFNNQLCRTYIDAGRIETNDVFAGNLRIVGHHIRPVDDKFVLVSNHAGTNFDGNGSVGFQVYGGVGLGQNTIYTASRDLYIQNGNAVQNLGQSYSDANKTSIHCQNVISQVANTVSSRLSVKTAITKVDYDRALMAIQNTDMYDYRYTSDDSNQHYVSGIIDDIHDKPEYNLDPMLINKERTARIDANLLGYHHVVLQEMLKEIEQLKTEIKQLEAK